MNSVFKLLVGVAVLVAIPCSTAFWAWWRFALVDGAVMLGIGGLCGAFVSCVIAPGLWDVLDMVGDVLEAVR